MSVTLLLAAVIIVVVVTVWAVVGSIGDLCNLCGNGSGGLSWKSHSGGAIVHVSMSSDDMSNAQTYLKPRRPTMRSLIGLNILKD
jgi:hypothetical protein